MNLIKIILSTVGYYVDKYTVHFILLAMGYFLCHLTYYLNI